MYPVLFSESAINSVRVMYTFAEGSIYRKHLPSERYEQKWKTILTTLCIYIAQMKRNVTGFSLAFLLITTNKQTTYVVAEAKLDILGVHIGHRWVYITSLETNGTLWHHWPGGAVFVHPLVCPPLMGKAVKEAVLHKHWALVHGYARDSFISV